MPSPGTRMGRWGWLLRPGRNPLSRPGDRFEARLLAVLALLVVLAVPAAVAVGGQVHADRLEAARQEAATRQEVRAELMADAPLSVSGPRSEMPHVPARWQDSDGEIRVENVPAPPGTRRGGEVSVWLDESGAVTGPPKTPTGAVFDGIGAGVLTWCGVLLGCVLLQAAAHRLVARMHADRWAREWARVAREWSHS
ncbi:hypothetical protein B0I33_110316 [Prauserella shujinwangii]|uniref:Transmembrane protein n=1 Tax=Prauserella shujinwangii TaxID=1453103 RepID=A0A2T0LPX6_9PSEU|nr:hypothetical protein [Prauserella shujinwangii]PRX45216.1 hypothetical protein B0I33_110316 [Prauserella shujinwangii]